MSEAIQRWQDGATWDANHGWNMVGASPYTRHDAPVAPARPAVPGMTYEDVTYALDAAGTQTVSLPSNSATPLVVLAEIAGRQHTCTVTAVNCVTDASGALVVQLVAEMGSDA